MPGASQTIRGTLRPDGTIELAGRPDLPSGPVDVTIRAVPAERETLETPDERERVEREGQPGEDMMESIQRIRARREAEGFRFRSAEEIEAKFANLRGERPEPTAGPVEAPAPAEDWLDYLIRSRAELEASGHKFRTKEEIDAEIEEMRSDWDDRIEEAYRQIEEEQRGSNADLPG